MADHSQDGDLILTPDELGKASPTEIPRELPILPIRGVVVFPGTVVPLTIGREKSKLLTDAVLAGDRLLAVFAQRHEQTLDPTLDDIYRVGTAATVLKLLRMPDGTNSLLVHGLKRVGIEQMITTEPYWKATIHAHDEAADGGIEIAALAHSARQSALEIIELSPNIPDEAAAILRSLDKPSALADYLAANLSLGLVQKQELLETFDIGDRFRKINATLNNQLEILRLSQKIQDDVRKGIDKTQRDYFLQEQMRAIQRELGEGEEGGMASQIAELRKQVADAGMPEAVLKEANRELDRLGRLSQASPEHALVRDYLQWLIEMPWTEESEDQLDLKLAEHILDEDHYGLEKIKRRILEYLAVRKLKQDGRGPILCFVGPPGVGKTSLGQSIARALGRKFARIALGGVRDEADIRGHRRTYIGSIPGRIVQEIRKCGVRNPVLMLDELDKLGRDMRGDPGAALLEVLDPAQNHNFTDHYLGVPIDLSKVFFIATANYLDPVDAPLRDRMEIIELSGYTIEEKVEIAKRYLVPRQAAENGLKEDAFRPSADVLREIIEGYTREAGVRTLERKLGSICRGLAARVARDGAKAGRFEPKLVAEFLGPRPFEREMASNLGVPGVVTGLAYTPVGGQIMFIEATAMPGRGSFQLTGQIGDVMRESAQAALSVVRSNAKRWGIELSRLSQTDIHVHVPAGAIPKDGPSAGVAMVSTLVSLLTDRAAKADVGMTGEITLRGLVLPIGGVKEKVLAAHLAGLKTVILPKRNEPDLAELPKAVRDEMTFVLAATVDEVLAAVFPEEERSQKSNGRKPAATAASKRKSPQPGKAATGLKRTGKPRRASASRDGAAEKGRGGANAAAAKRR
ncbi:MAG: endopeptidase La [Phycisphaerae bacterium]|nr:endopeptidase La [Phycisphaerae bacterium]